MEHCPQCKILTKTSESRLVQDSCGHKKCRLCLLKDNEQCLQCANQQTAMKQNLRDTEINQKKIFEGYFQPNNEMENNLKQEINNSQNSNKNINTRKNITGEQFEIKDNFDNTEDVILNSEQSIKVDEKVIQSKQNCNLQKNKTLIQTKVNENVKACFKLEQEYFQKNKYRSSDKIEIECLKIKNYNYKTVQNKKPYEIPNFIKIIQNNPTIYKCINCKHEFKIKYNCSYHIYCNEKQTQPFKCHLCTKTFRTQSHFKYHLLCHDGKNPFVCNICDKGFKNKSKLNRHISIHNTVKQIFNCNICNANLQSKQSLNRHYKLHNLNNKKYKCKKCDKLFLEQNELNKHYITHKNIKQYICDICKKCYKRKYNLLYHIQNHTLGKYICNFCNKIFIKLNSLKKHKRKHLNNNYFQCNYCKKKFTRKDNLERHIRGLHLESNLLDEEDYDDDNENDVNEQTDEYYNNVKSYGEISRTYKQYMEPNFNSLIDNNCRTYENHRERNSGMHLNTKTYLDTNIKNNLKQIDTNFSSFNYNDDENTNDKPNTNQGGSNYNSVNLNNTAYENFNASSNLENKQSNKKYKHLNNFNDTEMVYGTHNTAIEFQENLNKNISSSKNYYRNDNDNIHATYSEIPQNLSSASYVDQNKQKQSNDYDNLSQHSSYSTNKLDAEIIKIQTKNNSNPTQFEINNEKNIISYPTKYKYFNELDNVNHYSHFDRIHQRNLEIYNQKYSDINHVLDLGVCKENETKRQLDTEIPAQNINQNNYETHFKTDNHKYDEVNLENSKQNHNVHNQKIKKTESDIENEILKIHLQQSKFHKYKTRHQKNIQNNLKPENSLDVNQEGEMKNNVVIEKDNLSKYNNRNGPCETYTYPINANEDYQKKISSYAERNSHYNKVSGVLNSNLETKNEQSMLYGRNIHHPKELVPMYKNVEHNPNQVYNLENQQETDNKTEECSKYHLQNYQNINLDNEKKIEISQTNKCKYLDNSILRHYYNTEYKHKTESSKDTNCTKNMDTYSRNTENNYQQRTLLRTNSSNLETCFSKNIENQYIKTHQENNYVNQQNYEESFGNTNEEYCVTNAQQSYSQSEDNVYSYTSRIDPSQGPVDQTVRSIEHYQRPIEQSQRMIEHCQRPFDFNFETNQSSRQFVSNEINNKVSVIKIAPNKRNENNTNR